MFAKKIKAGLVSFALVAFGLGAGAAWGQAGYDEQPGGEEPRTEEIPQAQPPQQQQAQQIGQAAQQALGQVYAFNATVGQFGLLGINRAENDDVRNLAEEVYEGAQQSNSDLMQWANERDIEVVGTEAAKQALQQSMQRVGTQLQELQAAEGPNFDRQYMQIVVQAHEQALTNLQQARELAQQEELQRAIDERLSTVEENLEAARELQQEVQQQQQQQLQELQEQEGM